MRYKGPRLSEIIRNIYHRDPLNGDIYIYMSRDRRTIRLFQYKHHVYDLHERTFSNEYRFKKVVLREGVPTYKVTIYFSILPAKKLSITFAAD